VRPLSTTTRISLSLAFLTVSVLLAADLGRLVPDVIGAELRGREALCEAVALQSSSQVVHGELSSVETGLRAIASRNPAVLSIGIRRNDGTMVSEWGKHADHWTLAPGAASTPTQVRVPVFQDDKSWGTVEIRFRDIPGAAWGPLQYPLARLSAFLFLGGLLTFRLYLRRVLQYLDPSLVIPERVKLMLDTLAEGVLVVDTTGRIVLANQGFATITGKEPHDLIGVPTSRFGWSRPKKADEQARPIDEADLPWVAAVRDHSVHRGVPMALERPDGMLVFSVNAAPITAGKSTVQGALVTFDDVTAIEKNNAQLQSMLEMLEASRDEIDRQNRELQALAMTDPLTGCLNRRSFFAQFDTHWSAAERYGHGLSCVMVDVDFFKKINDQHGHAAGDVVLERVANVLKSLLRGSDLICRYGGEEFCVLLPHTDARGALEVAERFRHAIAAEPCGPVRVTASLGVSTTTAGIGATSPQELLNHADEALYASKRSGRNRVTLWSAAIAAQAHQAPVHA
jgi:diguanylate cyclase (GGDEF)-like protein/PAS domain S-box-containing protein